MYIHLLLTSISMFVHDLFLIEQCHQSGTYSTSQHYPWQDRVIIYTEENAKVVSAIWGTKWIQFIATLAVLHQDDLKKGMNSSYSSYRPGAIHPILQIVLVQNS